MQTLIFFDIGFETCVTYPNLENGSYLSGYSNLSECFKTRSEYYYFMQNYKNKKIDKDYSFISFNSSLSSSNIFDSVS